MVTFRNLPSWCVGLATLLLLTAVAFWNYLPPLSGPQRLVVILPDAPPGTSEPLVVSGRTSAGDFLFVTFLDHHRLTVGYDSWSRGGPTSAPIPYRPGARHTLEVEMPSLAQVPGGVASPPPRLRVVFDRTVLLDSPVAFFPRRPSQLWFGENPLGGTSCGPEFHGRLFREDGRPLRGDTFAYFTRLERFRGWLWVEYRQGLALLLLGGAVAWSWYRLRHGPPACASPGSLLRVHRTFALTAAFCCLAFAALLTSGTFRLIFPESFGNFYDFQAASLLRGRLDVPEEALQGESFVHDGKIYGYFGLTPALLRLPFVIFGVAFGELSRAAMLLCYAATLVGSYLLLLDATRLLRPDRPRPAAWQTALFTAHVGLGSTVFFLGSRAYIYHEAILWGLMFAVFSCWCALRHLAHPAGRWWRGALVLGVLSVHARPPTGLFALTVLGAVAATHLLRSVKGQTPASGNPLRPIAIGVLAVAGVASFNALSYAKFRTFEGCPLRLNVQYSASRLARIDSRQFHAANLPYGFASYLARPTFEFTAHFPWLYLGPTVPPREFPGAKLDLPDRTAALPYGMTGLFVLATVVCAWAGLKLPAARAPVFLLWASAVPLFLAMFAAIATAERYTGDFVPFLICAGAFGLAAPVWRPFATAALAVATFWSCALTLAMTLHYQGVMVWGVPDDVQQNYRQLRQRVDGFFAGSRPTSP